MCTTNDHRVYHFIPYHYQLSIMVNINNIAWYIWWYASCMMMIVHIDNSESRRCTSIFGYPCSKNVMDMAISSSRSWLYIIYDIWYHTWSLEQVGPMTIVEHVGKWNTIISWLFLHYQQLPKCMATSIWCSVWEGIQPPYSHNT